MQKALKEERKTRDDFERRLYERWKKGLDLFETILLLGRNGGADFNNKIRPYAVKENDIVFEVLVRLHARSCMIFSEILSLLRSGHASGALARARTLHELRVTALLIQKGGNTLAEQYFLYEVVENLHGAKKYEKYYQKLGLQPLEAGLITKLETAVQNYQQKFQINPNSLKGDYGWASILLNKERPTFADIEKYVQQDHWRPYFKFASNPVHAGAKGIVYDIGYLDSKNIVFAGASNAGLAEPANIAMLAFQVITACLLLYMKYSKKTELLETYIKSEVTSVVMHDLIVEANHAFIEAHEQQVREEAEKDKK
jgi:hypothetical protein